MQSIRRSLQLRCCHLLPLEIVFELAAELSESSLGLRRGLDVRVCARACRVRQFVRHLPREHELFAFSCDKHATFPRRRKHALYITTTRLRRSHHHQLTTNSTRENTTVRVIIRSKSE